MTRGTTACLLFSALAASFVACGGRTDTEFDQAGAGGLSGSIGGDNHNFSGSPAVGGNGVSGAFSAGAPSFAGAPPGHGGSPSFGGTPNAGGAPGSAGFPTASGAPGFGGFPSGVAGAPFGGFPGDAGAGGSDSVIVDACVAIAQTDCNKCLCQVCSDAVIGCFTDFGCTAIFGCIEQNGYTSATCRAVIKANGGLAGAAANKVFSLLSCGASSQNVCACN